MPKSCCSDTGQMPSSEAVNVANLVEYAPESIVSRQLIKNDAGTITLFAFDKGQSLSEHSAPFDAVVQIVDGQAELVIGGQSVLAKVGQMVVMPADVPHAVKAPQKFKMLLTMLRARNEK
jgi:quercetin dioxygenase-like cupin family protein